MSELLVIQELDTLVERVATAEILELPAQTQVLVETVHSSELLIEPGVTQVLETPPVHEVLIDTQAGPQGPPGPAGAGGAGAEYEKRVEFINDDEFYKGEALLGSLDSAASWKISHTVVAADGGVTTKWAGGTREFTHTWELRSSYAYL